MCVLVVAFLIYSHSFSMPHPSCLSGLVIGHLCVILLLIGELVVASLAYAVHCTSFGLNDALCIVWLKRCTVHRWVSLA